MIESAVQGFRLSPQQEHLLSLPQTGPGTPYRVLGSISITGEVDADLLATALLRTIERHEILRTSFRRLPGASMTLQVIEEEAGFGLRRHDLRDQEPAQQERAERALLEELMRGPLNLETGGVLRAHLLTLSAQHHRLLLSLPSLCADAGTMKVLVHEIGRGYEALLRGVEPEEEPVQYADLAEWQNGLLESAESREAKRFWRRLPLRGELEPELPFPPAALGMEELTPRSVPLELPPDLAHEVFRLARLQGHAATAVLVACWQALLLRLTGQEELVVGLSCNGRRYEELQAALGLFARTLPLPGAADEETPFSELLARTAALARDMAEWQEFFDWKTWPERTSGFLPFCLEHEELPDDVPAGAAVLSLARCRTFSAPFRLKLSFWSRGELLDGELHYDAASVRPEDAQRVAIWYRNLLANAVRSADAPIGELDFLGAPESWDWAAALVPAPVDLGAATLPELVERQAERSPDGVALVFRDQQVTWAELVRRANRLSRLLRRLGVGPEVPVALAVDRSLEMVLGMMGIHQAGGAYVPLDPGYPQDRLAFMLADSQAAVVVTEERLLPILPPLAGPVLCLDRDGADILRESDAPLERQAGLESLAYVIYTSGSTGRPKGVMVSHGAIANRLLWMQRVFPVGERDCILQKTPYSFDASIWEIFLPLMTGAREVVAEPGGHRDNAYLLESVATHGVTTLQLVPSLLGAFLQEPGAQAGCRSLRRLFCGGEALPDRLRQDCLELLPAALCNLYGPTEAAIDATFHPCGPEKRGTSVPIGRPLYNVRVYLLDDRGRPVPPGAQGELHIGGVGLARGYRGRPDLSAERFIPDPFGATGERLYRTGDLVRLLAGGDIGDIGDIEFLGRVDHQVKVRGFRIELGEIEAVLASHPKVQEAVVVASQAALETPGDQRLVAYVVPRPHRDEADPIDGDLAVDELGRYLSERLPDYMVPSAFVPLESLPLLPNGKLDRAALPAPEVSRQGERSEALAPRTPTEELLVGVWSELLSRQGLGVQDDFFESGGHSLLVTLLVSRVRQVFNVEFRLRQVFEAPTIAGMAREIDSMLQQSAGVALPPIERVPRSGALPLSFSQQRLWFLHQLDPLSSAYHLPVAVRLRGRLDRTALEVGLHELVRRHESLRTSFPAFDGRPLQVIDSEGRAGALAVDLTALPPARRETEAERLALIAAWRPFDIGEGPLLRWCVIRVDAEDHLLAVSLHHIISDGWSTGVLVRELMTLYTAHARGVAAALPSLPLQYVDYSAWQHQWLSGAVLETQLEYWKKQLGGELPVLRLPFDRPRSAARTSSAAGLDTLFPSRLLTALRELGLREGCSLFMTLLAGFEILLSSYSGQKDLVIGTPIANRNRVEVEGIVGLFVNSLALRTRWGGDPTVRDLLRRVREVALGAFVHQEMPFEKLVDELQAERSSEHLPVFQVMFMLQNFPNHQDFELPGLQVSATPLPSETAKFDLLVELHELDEGLFCGLEFKSELFDTTTVQRLLVHLRNVLEGIVDGADRRLSSLSVLTAAERHQLASEWNDTETAYPSGVCIQDLFARSVEREPEAVAVVSGGGALTYREVDLSANRLAQHLRALGAGPGTLVAVYLERSADMVPALLGVLKAGAAYVPLDPDYPPGRLQYLLSDLGIEHLLTQGPLLEVIAALDLPSLRHLVCLSGEVPSGLSLGDGKAVWLTSHLERLDGEAQVSRSSSRDLAYIIFTSGSTGAPKGVMVRHRPVVNLIHWLNRRFAVDATDRLLFITSLCFDLSVYDVFGILAAGGTVRVASREEVEDPEALVRILYGEPVTFWDSAPAALQRLVAFFPPADAVPPPSRLRRVFLSGDWVPLALPGQVRRAFPGAQVVALGGATEATVWSNYFPVYEIDPFWVSVPYGRPIENARYYVLDEWMDPCAVGVEGDLYIGGDCLFSGYVRDAQENAVKNLPDPFGPAPGARLYRTGDRARFRADGNIEFLGRLDHQVKIRGYRIELGEIEASLLRHADVRQAVALVREDAPGDRRLVAYFVAEPGSSPEARELRQFLQELLPDYMVPTALVQISEVPVTANGKLDRAALPAPELTRERLDEDQGEPRSRVERLLVEIWRDILRLEAVGIHENFFELGGDSILSIQVVARARQSGLGLNPRDLFEYQTIAELAATLGEIDEAVAADGQEPEAGPASLSPVQHWFFELAPAAPHHFNQSVLLALRSPFDDAHFARSVGHLLTHHDALRSRFFLEPSGWRLEIAPPDGTAPSVRLDLSALPEPRRGEELERCASALQAGLDLGAGPLLRAALFDFGAGEGQRLLLIAHHLVVDGISWRILLEDLFTLYRQAEAGEALALPPKTASVASWTSGLEESVRSGALAGERTYWLAHLNPSARPLPRDLSGGRNDIGSAREVRASLSGEETRWLQAVPQSYPAQVRDLLLTAFVRALSSWAGAPVIVEIEGHGRETLTRDVDLSRTIGWFTAIHPLLFDLDPLAGPDRSLKLVKETLRTVPRGGIGYGALRYLATDPEVALPALPRGEAVFNYLGQLDQALPQDAPVGPAQEGMGALADPRLVRPYVLEVNASIAGGSLFLTWTYSEGLHHRATIEGLSESFLTELRSLIDHCRTAETPGFTPADFPLAGLGQAALDRLAARHRSLEDLYPLSPLQLGILVHSLEPEIEGVYQQQLSCRIHGELQVEAFVQAWQRVIDRHPILRTAFAWEDLDRPLQMVMRNVRVPIEHLDWSALPEPARESRLRAYREEGLRQPFQLASAPLVRFTLIRLSGDEHVFIWSFHHLLLDGWSVGRIIAEVFESYGLAAGGEERRAERVRPYRDYIVWLGRQDRGEAERFWRRELAGFTAPTPVGNPPGRFSPPDGRVFRENRTVLSDASTARLRSWAQQHKITLATLVEAAWARVLSVYSGQRDVLFGSVSAGRPPELPGIETMVGLFINSLPVRARVDTTAPLAAWLTDFQRLRAESRQYEYCPLVDIQGWSEVPSGLPLFESLIVFENYPVADLVQGQGAGNVEVQGTEFVTWNHFPLTIVAEPHAALGITVSWDSRRFETAEVERLLGHLHVALESFPECSDGRVADLSFLSPAERRQLREWGSGEVVAAAARASFPRLFERMARSRPEAPAVRTAGGELSYAELDRRSNRLAHHLRALGVGPEVRVGILLRRSPEALTALLAVLKAGGAYVPLDPEHPQERLGFVARDAALRVVVTEGLAGLLPEPSSRIVDLAAEETVITAMSDGPLGVDIGPDSLAYVLYTSGSTGRPKGVMVPHRGLANYLDYAVRTYGLGPHTKTLVHSPLTFDLTITGMFAPLVTGGRVDLLGEEAGGDGFAAALEQGSYDLVKLTPAHLAALRQSMDAATRVGALVIGGEALAGETLAEWRERDPEIRLINEYGPTEAVVGCCVYEVPPGHPAPGPVPIGRAISNATLSVLDDDLQPVPASVMGGLYIGGGVVSRGYMGSPALTAERFLPDPFSSEPGARLYRSGDLARFRGDGILEYLGRDDHQVKVRGFRIELGEIEAVLLSLSEVREAVVLAREDEPGNRRLVAYLVGEAGAIIDTGAIRSRLAEELPEYMIPAAFVVLGSLPLTAHGKVDRASLPAPEALHSDRLEKRYLAPRTETEQKLAEIWAEVLGVDRVGVDESFFDLGGDSILGLQMASRARRAGLRVSSRQIFEYPTVEALAAIARVEAPAAGAEAPKPESGPVPLTPIQLWFLEQEPVDVHHFNQALLLEATEPLDATLLERAAKQVAEHHDALRLRFEKSADGWRQLYGEGADGLPLTRMDLSSEAAEGRSAALEEEATRLQRSLDLQRGPMARIALFEMGEGEPQRVLLLAHHLVIDAVSWRILLEDLEESYLQLRAGQAPKLPAKTSSFRLWSEKLVEHARSGVSAGERDYWSALAAAAVPVLPAPAGSAGLVGESSFVSASLGEEETRLLLERVPRTFQAEIGDVLMTGLVEAFRPWTGSRRLLVDLERHGREELWEGMDLSRTVGWFTSLFPVLLDLEGTAGADAAIRAAREQLRTVPGHGLGWGLLRYLGSKSEQESLAAVQPQVLFNYLGQVDHGLPTRSLLRAARESAGSSRSRRQSRSHLLEINGVVAGGRLQVGWTFSTEAVSRKTVERLAADFIEALRAFAASCASSGRAAELAAAGVSQDELSRALSTVGSALGEDASTAIGAVYPLSPSQEGMLYESLSNPGSGAHIEQWSCGLHGTLDPAHLTAAWMRVLERHAILRTGFVWEGLERPLQVVFATVPLSIEVEDWRQCPDKEERLAKYLADDSVHDFDLARPPLLRVAMLRLSDDVCRLLWTHHHILLDGWCRARVFDEVLRTYQAIEQSVEIDLGPNPPYQRYIEWLMSQDTAQAEEYWRRALAGFQEPTPLGRETDLSAVSGDRYRHVERIFDPAEAQALRALAQRHRLTLNTLFQAGWGLLLSRYSGSTDVLFGITVSGRPEELPDVEAIVGPFISTVPLRLRVAPGVPVLSWLAQIQKANLDLRAYESTPATRIREWSEVPPAQPLYHSILVYENYPTPGSAGGTGTASSVYEVDDVLVVGARTQYAATLLVHPVPDLSVRLVFDAHRLAAEDAPRLLEDLRSVMVLLAAAPELQLGGFWESLAAIEPPRFASRRAERADTAGAARSPRTPTEELIAGVWAELLGIEQPGTHEDFFSLGGHSLVATQAMSRLRRVFGRDLPLRLIFEGRTVSGLAALIDEAMAQSGLAAEAPPLVPAPRNGELPLSFAEQRLWFLEQLNPGQATFNIPVALRVQGPLDVAVLRRALGEVVRRHENLRTSFPTVDGSPVRAISPGVELDLTIVDLSSWNDRGRDTEVRRLVDYESTEPFDLARGPLLRVRLLRLGETEHVLIFTIHHIVSDAWSAGVLVAEVGALFAAFRQGLPSPLPELPVQYADYAAWQRQWLEGEPLESQLSYWQRQLGGDLPTVELAGDRPRPEIRSLRGASLGVVLPETLSDALRAFSRQHEVTLFMTLLTAFKVLLYHRTLRDDIVVGTDVAGRNRLETESLVGFFVNQLALRTRLVGNPTFDELLERVRNVTLEAYAHQELPFDQVVDRLGLERSLSHAPVFQVKLFVTNTPMGDLELGDVTLEPLEVETGAAQIDLTIAFREARSGPLGGWVNFSTDLYEAATVARLMTLFERLLTRVVAHPETRLSELRDFLAEQDRELRSAGKTDWNQRHLEKLRRISPQKVQTLPQDQAVTSGTLQDGQAMPLLDQTAVRRETTENT